MRKLTMCLLAAAALSASAMTAQAQTLAPGAAGFHALAQNATPIVTRAACQGWGPYCRPGFVRVCGPYHCWCRPCR